MFSIKRTSTLAKSVRFNSLSTRRVQRFNYFNFAIGTSFIFGLGYYLHQQNLIHNEEQQKLTIAPSVLPLSKLYPPKYCDEEQFKEGLAKIVEIVGKENVNSDSEVLAQYNDSFYSTHHPPDPNKQRPSAVVKPGSTEEVSKIMKIANAYAIPIVANSGLTSIEGQFINTQGPLSISVSFARMDNIIELHPEDLDVVVQPGVGWQDLDAYLQDSEEGSHLMFGPDPGPGACIGGMIGTSCSGTNAYKYGTCKESIINLTVVLADGTIVKTKQRSRKSSAGYDMTHLFIGSEGTLGLVTEATLKLSVRPKKELVCIASFPTIRDATNVASKVISQGIQPNAMEILDDRMISFVNKTSDTNLPEKPTLFFKIGGPSKVVIDEQINTIENLTKENKVVEFKRSTDEDENLLLWQARKTGFWSSFEYGKTILKDKDDVQGWGTDIAVPVSKLPDMISDTNDDLLKSGFKDRFAVMGHIGDGNCHFIILYNTPDYHKVQQAVDRMVFKAIDYEGTCTGEHGVGVGKRRYLVKELGQSTIDLERQIKLALDPKRILNPDKIFKIDPNDTLEKQLEGGKLHDSQTAAHLH
ncbi:unnamed protein product [Candida verbasci]|uniref:D-lactate dehydrogenase (cytochrome) n=1 Tax=Candida verbasci TaxID=1227364 RepID=A0A9W4TWV6_9ASCO|nr:unnamed protein product [Candida verbasci]